MLVLYSILCTMLYVFLLQRVEARQDWCMVYSACLDGNTLHITSYITSYITFLFSMLYSMLHKNVIYRVIDYVMFNSMLHNMFYDITYIISYNMLHCRYRTCYISASDRLTLTASRRASPGTLTRSESWTGRMCSSSPNWQVGLHQNE